MKIEFKENQKFTQWWVWLILITIGIIPIVGIYKQLIPGKQFGDKPMSDLGLIIFSVSVFCLIAMFWFMRLKTEIDQNEIRINFFPFIKKQVNWTKIKSAEMVNYGFVGGWGIRPWTKHGTVYNMKGNKGLAIELLSGEKFLIGTQKEVELGKIIEKLV
ncbi:phosphoethanolamine transferase domain-containing protein [Algibacter lectus]|uniref:phosphoethanolamine transferase domain-containing protein n=1 Tax=Algibacter lectus TaxID=221126 RepID=UPI0024958CFF|nr:phosphoethanolamine transferase domain-containing protein [Algibacter lectus]